MNVYRVTLLVVDHDRIGPQQIQQVIESTRYPNRCIHPLVLDIEERSILHYDDNHPINSMQYKDAAKTLFE